MNPCSNWQNIAERLADSGWSWKHETFAIRAIGGLHLAEARNEEGEQHVVIAETVGEAFVALEESIRAATQ